ncbi:Myb-like, SWIRM and MPN domains 1 [Dissophora globulifera]|uniref:Myb-like, SWIRM and MPN domains 1 n=1 Tax=Dissophora globulifera TaxID=979702 RepID=A0A9P6RUB8_9FUNG|nr:Myb-like, SWIRM and MPN domains 1 [Dissophora globulifera]
MAEDEEDIDIDIDIDGDESEEQGPAKALDLKRADRIQKVDSKTASLDELSDESVLNKHSGFDGDQDMKSYSVENDETETSPGDDFQLPDWVTQDEHAGFDPGDMDEKSRRMIESMLAEEEFYSGRPSKMPPTSSSTGLRTSYAGSHTLDTVSNNLSGQTWTSDGKKPGGTIQNPDSKKRKNSHERSGQTKRTASEDSRLNAKLSSADLPSHNTRWTAEEDARLRQGIDLHGYGNWKAIAAIVGTRNPLQVKNHARHLAMSEKTPHDMSTNTSDGEGLDRRSSAANSAEEDTDERGHRKRRPRSKHVKRIDASVGGESGGSATYSRHSHRARSVTSESGNEEFTGSEFGATSGYDTDNDEDRSTSKSPSLSARGGSRSGSVGLATPSPGLRPLYATLPPPYSIPSQRTGASSMDEDEDEDIDIDIESSDEESSSRLTLTRSLSSFSHKSKSRSISPFSNSSTRSRLSSESDSDSDRDMRNDDVDEIIESGNARKRSLASSPALSDTMGSLSDLYATPNFNTSTSSVSSAGPGSSFKPSIRDLQYLQQQQHHHHQKQVKNGPLSHLSVEKMTNSPKERRTVSFGAVHVAELKPDLHSYDEDDINSSEDGGVDTTGPSAMDVVASTSSLATLSCRSSTSPRSQPRSLSVSSRSVLDDDSESHSALQQSTCNASINRTYSRHNLHYQDDDEVYEEEEEGSLGTGAKHYPAASGALPSPRKAQRSTGSKSKSHSITFQQYPTVISPSPQALDSPPMTTISSPVTRRILDKSIITEEEKRVHSEFFCNKASKTPERYQRIRNTILHAWEKSPSTYLTKTSVRSGLKDCGDVNAIGRVHSWLESIGAINVGMTASSPGASLARPRNGGNNSSKRRGHSEERGWSSSSSSSTPRRVNHDIAAELDDLDSVWVTPPIRRRRVRNEKGEWVDEKELEGRVIEHNVHSNNNGKPDRHSTKKNEPFDDLLSLDDEAFFERHGITKDEMEEELEQERLAAQNAKYFAATETVPINTRVPKSRRAQRLMQQTRGIDDTDGDDEAIGGYDPFRLVPLRKYSTINPAPFRVKVSSDAMLIMDFHSHMAETEVIGLLGGLYDEDERILFILGVFPCRSISTGLQCEMDPTSEIEARQFFSSKGFVVVGWYHSHPTFEPNPSIRDIENQCGYQELFRRQGTGVEPFVGVIVSPFDPRNLSSLSKFQFLTVSEQYDEHLQGRVPYGFDREITRTNELSVAVFQQLTELARYYKTHEHLVDLTKPLRRGEMTTRLDKLLRSLNHHIFVDESMARAFLGRVRELIVRGFNLSVDRDTQAGAISSSNVTAETLALSAATTTLTAASTSIPADAAVTATTGASSSHPPRATTAQDRADSSSMEVEQLDALKSELPTEATGIAMDETPNSTGLEQ